MKAMTTDELREAYLSFFESKGCVRKPSDLLVPTNDPSVLFTPAGMNQFKEQFMGIGKLEFTRATSCQKCIRTGDIENVGKTRFHMTFFEMLGNFSFGDYFKRDAIHWAWEFCTRILKIDGERLRFSVFKDDDEAAKIWQEEIGIPTARIRRCDEDDNFWPAGAPTNGPDGVCGPCSEIFVDLGGGNEVEIWNLVFTQFNRVGPPPNNLHPLPKKNIDTGMGLERTAAVLQGVPTSFDIDIFKPIVQAVSEAVGVKYEPGKPDAARLRRIAEHARTVVFCMHENVLPSNEKQGYMVRRLLRRAVLDAYQLKKRDAVVYEIVPAIVAAMRTAYPDIAETASLVQSRIKMEEEKFLSTVERGIERLQEIAKRLEATGSDSVSGAEAAELYKTHGFPLEITEEIAAGRNLKVDRAGFVREMEEHSKKSGRGAFSDTVFTVGPIQELKEVLAPTEFLGYAQTACIAEIKGIIAQGKLQSEVQEIGHKDPIALVLDKTVFYGESGGQVGDVGTLSGDHFEFQVIDTQKTDGYIQHIGHIVKGRARLNMKVAAAIDAVRRAGIQRAHSATHVLHAALHKHLGEHAKQAGSKVENDALRFDFGHPQPVGAEVLAEIERWANERIMEGHAIAADVKPIEEARKMGAMALFGEKYGDMVRVVTMGDFSREFCGGCHLSNTGQIGPLKIVREESVAAGTRRIIAYTGNRVFEQMRQTEGLLSQSAGLLKVQPQDVPKRIEALQKEIRDLQKAAKQKSAAGQQDEVAGWLAAAVQIDGATVIVAESSSAKTVDDLRVFADQIRAKVKPVALLLAATDDARVHLLASATDDLVGRGFNAGKWIGAVAPIVGGKGGGRPNMAQGGGPDRDALPQALRVAADFASAALKP